MKNKTWMFVVFGILMVLVVITFIAAYIQDHANTRILLQVCRQPNGTAQYIADGYGPAMTEDQWACAEPEPLKWDSDRLTVAVVSAVDGSPLDGSGEEEAVYNAIELANDQLSTHLSTTMNPATADIVVIWRAAFNVGAAEFGDETGYCRHRWEAGRLRAEMAVRPSGDIRCEYQTALHELGHCLGLGHDDWGIMRTNYVCNDREEDRMQPDFYGDQQVDLIETTYP